MNANYPPPSESIPVIPWEDPTRSFFDGLFETVKLLATSPGVGFRRMPVAGGIGRPLFFAIAVGWVSIGVAVFWNVLLQGMWLPFLESFLDPQRLRALTD